MRVWLLLLMAATLPLWAESRTFVRPQKALAGDLQEYVLRKSWQVRQIDRIATNPGSEPVAEKRNGRDDRHSWRAPPRLFEGVRTILAVYSSEQESFNSEENNLIHRAAELPLNHLGCIVHYHDLATGLPPDPASIGAFAILSWLDLDSTKDPEGYCKWLIGQVDRGSRLVLMGEVPCQGNRTHLRAPPPAVLTALFKRIGLAYMGQESPTEIIWQDKAVMGFERPIGREDLLPSAKLQQLAPEVEPYLIVLSTEPSIAVCTTANGGYCSPGAALYIDRPHQEMRWLIDPFLFFERALGLGGTPRFDTTTLFGRRIFFTHIDGDGLRNPSGLREYREAGEVVLHEIIDRYPLPMTASLIACEVDPGYIGNSFTIALAKEIFRRANVETGVHGYSHPLDWERKLTVFAIPGYSREIDLDALQGQEIVSESGYSQGAQVVVPELAFLHAETLGAATYLTEAIAPPEKPVLINQWTGNCRPPARAIEMVHAAGMADINGGDGRFDRHFPTYTSLTPLTRSAGGQRQVYAPNANENIYTNNWSGPYYGLVHVIETYQQSERPTLIGAPPRRVLPMNLYYHYYSGERESALYALRLVFEYVMRQEPIAIFASHYSRLVHDFFSATVEPLEGGGWLFSHYGKCQTVRFDREPRWPDLERSSGVLGYVRWEESLYIHLARASSATLYLSERESHLPYLVASNTDLLNAQVGEERIAVTLYSFGTVHLKFANIAPNCDYRVLGKEIGSGTLSDEWSAKSDRNGILEIALPLEGAMALTIEPVDCRH